MKNFLFNSGVDQAVDFARVLDELRTKCNLADYNMEATIFQNQTDCAWLVAKAEVAIKTLSALKRQPLRQQIQTGIRTYQSKIKYS